MPHPIPKYCSAMGCPRGVLQSACDLIPLPQSVEMLLEKNRFCHTQVGVHHIAEPKSATPDDCTRREYPEVDSPVNFPPRDGSVAPIPPAAPVPRVVKKAQNQHFFPHFSPRLRHYYVNGAPYGDQIFAVPLASPWRTDLLLGVSPYLLRFRRSVGHALIFVRREWRFSGVYPAFARGDRPQILANPR